MKKKGIVLFVVTLLIAMQCAVGYAETESQGDADTALQELQKKNDLLTQENQNLKSEIDRLTLEIQSLKNGTYNDAKDGYRKINADFVAGNANVYLSSWSKVQKFKVGGQEVQGDTIGIQLNEQEITWRGNYQMPLTWIDNKNLELTKLRIDVAIDDMGKDYSYPTQETKVEILGESKIYGKQAIEKFVVKRDGKFNVLEADITGYEDVYIVVFPPRNGRNGMSDDFRLFYEEKDQADHAYKDFILLKDIRVK